MDEQYNQETPAEVRYQVTAVEPATILHPTQGPIQAHRVHLSVEPDIVSHVDIPADGMTEAKAGQLISNFARQLAALRHTHGSFGIGYGLEPKTMEEYPMGVEKQFGNS